MGTPPPDVVDRFIDRYSRALEREGLALIQGRIASLFLIESGPFTLDLIAERLQVSRGSASTSTRALETLGVIERTSVPGDRRTHYRLADDPYDCWLRAELDRLRNRRGIILDTLEGLDNDPRARAQLGEMLELQELVIQHKQHALAKWSARNAELDLKPV